MTTRLRQRFAELHAQFEEHLTVAVDKLAGRYKAAVETQIQYGEKCATPWGMSESGYNAVDVNFNYQYRAFGVPGLGLQRGLAQDLVIAPYASVLALMVAPEEACANLQRLDGDGLVGADVDRAAVQRLRRRHARLFGDLPDPLRADGRHA